MTIKQIETLCLTKEKSLIEKYFGNIVREAIEKKTEIGHYDIGLPKMIEEEYLAFLKEIWKENHHDDARRFEDIIDKRQLSEQLTENKRISAQHAYNEAKRVTLWERLTDSNHEDVTNYKGILKDYTEALLMELRCDFLEDMK